MSEANTSPHPLSVPDQWEDASVLADREAALANAEAQLCVTKNGKPWIRYKGFGGYQPNAGRKEWIPNEQRLEIIRELASYGLRERDIAAAVNIDPEKFSEKKNTYLEIQAALDQGRAKGRSELMELSWNIISDKRDPARNQELARLHRLLKSEQPDTAEHSDEKSVIGGFTIEILPNKKKEEPTT